MISKIHKRHLIRLASISCYLLFIPALTSCEQDLPLYGDEQARLQFNFKDLSLSDSTVNYSFAYNRSLSQDTVWLEVSTMGYLSGHDRHFLLQQVPTGRNDAVAGQHYKSFDDETYRQLLVVKANAVTARVPILVLKDASLSTDVYTLRVSIKENQEFAIGYADRAVKTIYLTDKLTKPNNWNWLCNYYIGSYGTVKHQFMIDASGQKWDDDYLLNVVHVDDYTQQFYLQFLVNKISKALAAENAARAARGEGPLAEADGTLVYFPF